jgi:hypothetical protein
VRSSLGCTQPGGLLVVRVVAGSPAAESPQAPAGAAPASELSALPPPSPSDPITYNVNDDGAVASKNAWIFYNRFGA